MLSYSSALNWTCPSPAPVVTLRLILKRFRLADIHSGWNENRAGFRFYLLLSIFACRRPYSGFPIGANSHYFPIDYGLRPKRRGSACSLDYARFIPVHPTLPAISVGGDLSRSCNVHFMLRPANSVGLIDWVGQATKVTSPSRVPCRGKFRQHVTTLTRPLPIQPNGILLN